VPTPSRFKAILHRILRQAGYELHTAQYWDRLREWQKPVAPPGHFYSPYPDLAYIRNHEERIFSTDKTIVDVDLREDEQRILLNALAQFYPAVPFSVVSAPGHRYSYDNPNYSFADAIILYAVLRYLQPRTLIEVGCGYSTAATLDTNELFLQNAVQVVCVEPYPDLLLSLLKEGDRQRIRLITANVQEMELSTFDVLGPGDVLFVDSTHVSRTDSDVNFLLFEVLPRLASGVWIHFHDVFFPFEYPPHWVYEGRAWQEQYLVRVLLQTPSAYRIRYFHDMMVVRHRSFFEAHMPLCLRNRGASLWIEKV
jgi:hypothetical protein